MAGEQAPPPLRFAQVTMSLGRILHSHLSDGKPPSRPFARDRKQFLLRGASSPPKILPRTRRTRRRVRLKHERACGPSRALPGKNAAQPQSRAAAKPLPTPRPPRSGQPPPPPKQRRLSAANLPIDPAPAAQRPAPAASQTTALIRRKAPIDPAPAAQRPASRRHRPIAERRRFKG